MPIIYHRVVKILQRRDTKDNQEERKRRRLPPAAYIPCCNCCFIPLGLLLAALLLAAFGAVLVLSLIPLYLPEKTATPFCKEGQGKNSSFLIKVPETKELGPLTDTETTDLSTKIRSMISPKKLMHGHIVVLKAVVILAAEPANERHKRQSGNRVLDLTLNFCGHDEETTHEIDDDLDTAVRNDTIIFVSDSSVIPPFFLSTTTPQNKITEPNQDMVIPERFARTYQD